MSVIPSDVLRFQNGPPLIIQSIVILSTRFLSVKSVFLTISGVSCSVSARNTGTSIMSEYPPEICRQRLICPLEHHHWRASSSDEPSPRITHITSTDRMSSHEHVNQNHV